MPARDPTVKARQGEGIMPSLMLKLKEKIVENISTSASDISSATTVPNGSIQTDEKSTVSLDTKEQSSKSLLDDQNFAYKPYDVVFEYGSERKNGESYETIQLKPKKYSENQTL